MNLHGLAIGCISVVNPETKMVFSRNVGKQSISGGKQAPIFIKSDGFGEVQALSGPDVMKLNNQAFQGVVKKVYLRGRWHGIVRSRQVGQDMLSFDGGDWLITQILESWPDFTVVAVALQTEPIV